jgi:hypothetical protein
MPPMPPTPWSQFSSHLWKTSLNSIVKERRRCYTRSGWRPSREPCRRLEQHLEVRNLEQKLMPLSLDEFLRRFLLHILPQGFVRIRNFGFLANRRRATLLPLCFHLLGSEQQLQAEQNRSSTNRLFRSLALSEVRWPDEGHRAAYRCRNPTPLAARGHRSSMNARSPIRILRVPRHGSHFFCLVVE